jgi:hypothetical protein
MRADMAPSVNAKFKMQNAKCKMETERLAMIYSSVGFCILNSAV